MSEASSVNEYAVVDVAVTPVPSHESVSITVPSTSGEKLRISIVDQLGAIVSSNEETALGDSFRYVWDGRRSDGSLAPQGYYIVSILSDRRLMKGRAIIIR